MQNKSKKHEEITEQIREKRVSKKKPINFQLQLNDEQKEAKEVIINNVITVLSGKAGSGKTLLACQIALDYLFREEVKKIYITRPTVSDEEIGFLPGTLEDKLDPWVKPIYENLYLLYNREKIDALIKDKTIEIVPVSFMRGRTFLDSFIIVDEAQNCTDKQTEMVQTRIGQKSKMVICGDVRQTDLTRYRSGFGFLFELAEKVDSYGSFILKKNHRHPIVDQILELYAKKFEAQD